MFGNITKNGSLSFLPSYTGTTNQFASIPGVSVKYDGNGNLLTDNLNTYTWDPNWGNMLTVSTGSTTVTSTYDALGRMVENNASGTYTEIVYGPTGKKLATCNGQTLVKGFIALPGGAKAIYNSSGLAYYRHSDWLGSSRLTSTQARGVYSDSAYAPFGEQYANSGTADASFTGQDQDTVTSLYDFPARRYSPSQGRWISPDPAGRGAVTLANPQSWNRYAYVNNNPLALIDAMGLSVRHRPSRAHAMDEDPGDPPAPVDGADDNNDDNSGGDDDNSGNPPSCDPSDPSCSQPPSCDPNDPTCQLQDVSSTQLPPCNQNVTIPIPQQVQNAQYQQFGAAVTSVTLTADGDLAGFSIGAITSQSIQGLTLPAGASLTVQAAPGGFTMNVSGGSMNGYLELPTWYNSGVNYVQFQNGSYTNVNGEAFGISGSSTIGSMLGINSSIQDGLNNDPAAVNAGSALSNAVDNCDFGSGGSTSGGTT